ncbi:hypothetical protein [Pantoea cypripedii]|uniref:N-acetylglucosamine binding protein A domain-containing protein n=1 Tax=Pantoea cypripedii TaxID=55209 RepID=A0A6B9G3W8_PANCY|nr:hypothetical protein [Pantoea cypripedii]QGY32184.1 hypothetical protein CUN67_24640 [Pantoea cypripedii]
MVPVMFLRLIFIVFLFFFLSAMSKLTYAANIMVQRSIIGENICYLTLSANGDVLTIEPRMNGMLAYRVINANLMSESQGDLREPGEVLDCPADVVSGYNGVFYLPLSSQNSGLVFSLSPEGDHLSPRIIYKSNSRIDPEKAFLSDSRDALYILSRRNNHVRGNTVLEKIALDSSGKKISKLIDSNYRGSFISPDKTQLYLMGESSNRIISLVDFSIIRTDKIENYHSYLSSVIDNNGDIYSVRLSGQPKAAFIHRFNPFTVDSNSDDWEMSPSQKGGTALPYEVALSPTGLLYAAAKAVPEQRLPLPGLHVLRADNGETEGFIEFPLRRLNNHSTSVEVSKPVFDPVTGFGYSFFHTLAAINTIDNGREWGIWRFDPASQKSDIIFRKASAGKLQSMILQHGRLYTLVSGELNLFHLAEPVMQLENHRELAAGIIEGNSLMPGEDYYKISWQVRDERKRLRQQGDMLPGSADQKMLSSGSWPMAVAAKINAQQGFVQAGGRSKDGHIHPVVGPDDNLLWLPNNLKKQGWTVSLSVPEVDKSTPLQTTKWLINPVADFMIINQPEGGYLIDHVCLKLDRRKGGSEYITLSHLNTDNIYRWSYDLANAINQSSANKEIAAGEIINNNPVPLFSKFRNRLWLYHKIDGNDQNKYFGFSYQQGRCP